jgi:short-subunit dehydrogenase
MARYVVTGASSGIGREIALQLARAGHDVVALGRDRTRLDALKRQHQRIETYAIDLCDRAAIAAFAAEVKEDGPIDGLINNAAIQHSVRFDDPGYDIEQIAAEVETNLVAPLALSRLLLPEAPGKAFVIVNVGSALAAYPKRTSAVYSATKAGLRMFSEAINVQSAGLPIKAVDVVLPLVDAPMSAGRGSGKISAAAAAAAVVAALTARQRRVHVGKAKLLRVLQFIAPPLAAAIIRRL